MFELTINGVVYKFAFNMGFLKDINGETVVPVDGAPGVSSRAGLTYAVGNLLDGDIETLVHVLDLANRRQDPRLTTMALESYIDDPATDVDALFSQVIEGLKLANATRKATLNLIEAVEQRKQEMLKQN